jgi:hypothetical protein
MVASSHGMVPTTNLLDGIWRYIGIHPHHQQRCENYVQLAALIAKTLVGEKRQTWRGIIQSVIMRNFNSQAVERRKEDPHNKKDFNSHRVTGSYRIEYFLDWLEDFMDKVSVAKEELGPQRIAVAEKAGCEEVDKLVADIEEAIKKPMVERAAEKSSGYKATTTMDGTLKLSNIKKCKTRPR